MYQKKIIVGNLGGNPEIKDFEGGGKVANFSVATNKKYKNRNGELVSQTEWHSVTLYNQKAEVAEKYLKKGDLVLIEGEDKTRSWEDAQGQKHYKTELIGFTLQMLSSKPAENGQGQQSQQSQQSQGGDMPPLANDDDDDLPF